MAVHGTAGPSGEALADLALSPRVDVIRISEVDRADHPGIARLACAAELGIS
jgi:hypothetical protein